MCGKEKRDPWSLLADYHRNSALGSQRKRTKHLETSPDCVTMQTPREFVSCNHFYPCPDRVVTGSHPHFGVSCCFLALRLNPGLRTGVTPTLCSPCQVMRWFWTVVSSLTQEELARLLQFTTGSSQLPPGGFAALCPSFQIIAAPTHSTLPTAHTW